MHSIRNSVFYSSRPQPALTSHPRLRIPPDIMPIYKLSATLVLVVSPSHRQLYCVFWQASRIYYPWILTQCSTHIYAPKGFPRNFGATSLTLSPSQEGIQKQGFFCAQKSVHSIFVAGSVVFGETEPSGGFNRKSCSTTLVNSSNSLANSAGLRMPWLPVCKTSVSAFPGTAGTRSATYYHYCPCCSTTSE